MYLKFNTMNYLLLMNEYEFVLNLPIWLYWLLGLVSGASIAYLIIYHAVKNAIQSSLAVSMAILNERIQQLVLKNGHQETTSAKDNTVTGQSLNDRYKSNA